MPNLITDPIDLAIDLISNDLVVGADLGFTVGINAVAQEVRVRLQIFQGEYFLNLDTGVPYWTSILGQKYNQSQLRSIFNQEITRVPGVVAITTLDTTFDGVTRQLKISFAVRTAFGDTPVNTLAIGG